LPAQFTHPSEGCKSLYAAKQVSRSVTTSVAEGHSSFTFAAKQVRPSSICTAAAVARRFTNIMPIITAIPPNSFDIVFVCFE
jgi:hypothetical protein